MRPIFRRMAQLLGYERDEVREQHSGFTPGEVASLRDWWADSPRELFLRSLDVQATLYAEVLLSSRDDAALHEARGAILGLRKAASLVDEITSQYARTADSRVRDELNRAAADSRAVATFGSPAWR